MKRCRECFGRGETTQRGKEIKCGCCGGSGQVPDEVRYLLGIALPYIKCTKCGKLSLFNASVKYCKQCGIRF
jgi:hypothetical protein